MLCLFCGEESSSEICKECEFFTNNLTYGSSQRQEFLNKLLERMRVKDKNRR